jgi:hypothetical protein
LPVDCGVGPGICHAILLVESVKRFLGAIFGGVKECDDAFKVSSFNTVGRKVEQEINKVDIEKCISFTAVVV